jgi:arylformamidase
MDLEAEYNNRARVPEHPDIIAGWQRDAAAFRQAAGGEFDIAYGEHPRQKFDVFRSKDDQAGPMALFVHGGYWMSFDKDHFSHMARGLEFHGVPVAVPSYRLCPEVRISDIIEDMRRCCSFLWQRHGRRLVIAGHSAGGHLAAAMLATDWKALGAPEDLVIAGLGISGIYDMRPLIPAAVNATLKLDDAEARCTSPLLWATPTGVFEAWVGEAESDEFRRQSRTLVAAWLGGGVDARYREVPGANHFTVIAPLAQPDSAITGALAQLCGAP